jgi:EAL domain-containing protein (putative c-di-GMP-specific phosphodiesterase class I)
LRETVWTVAYLKIDRSFIEGLGRNPEDEAIVSGTIGVAHALGLRVVAEGVGTADQLAKVLELGCDLAQGHLYAEAVPSGRPTSGASPNSRRSALRYSEDARPSGQRSLGITRSP